MTKPWTIEWRCLPGIEPRRVCLTCVVPEKEWTRFRGYKSEPARELSWEGFQKMKPRWQGAYEIRRGYDAQ